MTAKHRLLARLLRPEPGEGTGPGSRTTIAIVRVATPGLIALAGVVLLLVGATAFGIALIGIAVLVVLIDWFARLSLRGESDIERDEAARDQFTRTGHWPGDDASGQSDAAPDARDRGSAADRRAR